MPGLKPLRFKQLIEQVLGRRVDLVSYGGLKARLDDDIRRDARRCLWITDTAWQSGKRGYGVEIAHRHYLDKVCLPTMFPSVAGA